MAAGQEARQACTVSALTRANCSRWGSSYDSNTPPNVEKVITSHMYITDRAQCYEGQVELPGSFKPGTELMEAGMTTGGPRNFS